MDIHHSATMTDNTEAYATDFYAWCLSTADLVRTEQWEAIDPAALAEELEDLGNNLKRELESCLEVLMLHLLKWAYQPSGRATGHSWEDTIVEQRSALGRLFRDNRSLGGQVPQVLPDVYPGAPDAGHCPDGALRAAPPAPGTPPAAAAQGARGPRSAGAPSPVHPPQGLPWTADQVLDADFWPAAPLDIHPSATPEAHW